MLKYLLKVAPETLLNTDNTQWVAENNHLEVFT